MKQFFHSTASVLVAASGLGCAAGSPPRGFVDEPGRVDASNIDAGGADASLSRAEPDARVDVEASAASGSCAGRCATPSDASGCFCDEACAAHHDCCADYASACAAPDAAPPPVTTCAGRCGASPPSAGCACDDACAARGSCCADYGPTCPHDAGAPHAGSCVAACGVKGAAGQCHCDPSCVTYADCCPDYAAMCGDGG